MRLRQRLLRCALAACALICVLPARALASATEESMLMDDQQLIYSSPSQIAWTLEQAKLLGIDRLKVSVVWSLVAPDAASRQRPSFDATDPAAYPPGAWTRYDRIVSYAQTLGLKVYFQLVPPGPAWALGRGKPKQGYPWSYAPDPAEFGKFAEAVGRRYSGSYTVQTTADRARRDRARRDRARSDLTLPPVPLPGLAPQPQPAAPATQTLPRVAYWGIWNEPNEGAWLNPQWRVAGRGRHRHNVDTAPALYRRLVDAAWSGLAASGHAGDTVLVGETASRGWIEPLPFVRELYCVDARDRPLAGGAAGRIGCPRSGGRATFAARNPGLFASAYAHHPYSFDVPPTSRTQDGNVITLANLGRLESTLNRIWAAYHHREPGGVQMYLTEWGYKSNPPNPFVRTSLGQQATWINQGEYMTYRDPYVRALAQFLLVDSRPKAGEAVGTRAYWGTFQTGLLYADEQPKPSYDAFRLPIWLPAPRHGSRVPIWGELRPGPHSGVQHLALQYRRGSGSWASIEAVSTSNPEGFFLTRAALPAAGAVRLAWFDPATGTTDYSRTVRVS